MNDLLVEENIKFYATNLFYNPYMRLSRSLSSLLVSTLPKLDLLDGFCASGIRGLRYKIENDNVDSLTFLDHSKRAVETALANAKINNIKASGIASDYDNFAFSSNFSFYEIDPFGSPSQHIYPSLHKDSYLSFTATDLAVLCGKEQEAIRRNYLARTITNEYCHETAARILIGFVMRLAGIRDLYFEPLMSFYYRHQIKVIGKVKKGKIKAYDLLSNVKMFNNIGPMWFGPLHNNETIKAMLKENNKRSYSDKEKINKILTLMLEENNKIPFFYSLHKLSSKAMLKSVPKLEDVLNKIKELGYYAVKTHFSPIGFKTDMPENDLIAMLKETYI